MLILICIRLGLAQLAVTSEQLNWSSWAVLELFFKKTAPPTTSCIYSYKKDKLGRAMESYFFQLHPSPFRCESIKKKIFIHEADLLKRCLLEKQLIAYHEALDDIVLNRTQY